MTGTKRVPRSRGALCGALLVLLGLWGGLLPFVGPYIDFGFAPDQMWVYNADRLQLCVAPAIATVLGGLVVLAAAGRGLAAAGTFLAGLGGMWFVVGGQVAALWDVPGVGAPLGPEEGRRLAEELSGFSALGVVVVFLAALTMGRFTSPRVLEDEDYDPRNDLAPPPGGSGLTQPLAPAFGRYARSPGDSGDEHVAGDPRDPRG